jgi:hypothetical protein
MHMDEFDVLSRLGQCPAQRKMTVVAILNVQMDKAVKQPLVKF